MTGAALSVDLTAAVGMSLLPFVRLATCLACASMPTGATIVDACSHKASVLSFMIDGVHPHDVGTIFDQQGVAIRTGHHCAQPVMQFFGIPATARASFAFYNTMEEVDALVDAIQKVQELFS